MGDVLAAVTGVFLFSVLLLLIYRELGNGEEGKESHKLIRYFLLGMIFLSCLFIPKILLDDTDYCSTKPVNSTAVNSTWTRFDYDYVCDENPNGTSTVFFQFSMITLGVCVLGWLVYLVRFVAKRISDWVKK